MFTEIRTHVGAHFDEYVAIVALRDHGEDLFPGVSTAHVTYMGADEALPDGKTASDLEREGVLLVGVGRGRFDEHAERNDNPLIRVCCATLVARALGLDEDPAWDRILKYASRIDSTASAGAFDLATTVKNMHAAHPDDPDAVLAWATMAIRAAMFQDIDYHHRAREDFRNVIVEHIEDASGCTYTFATVESDALTIAKFVRSSDGCQADIVLVRRSNGSAFIATNQRRKLELGPALRRIRKAEFKAKGIDVPVDDDVLAQADSVPGLPEWYFHRRGRMLLNGGNSTRGTSPTRLSTEDLRTHLRDGIAEVGTSHLLV